jgi:zinc protease
MESTEMSVLNTFAPLLALLFTAGAFAQAPDAPHKAKPGSQPKGNLAHLPDPKSLISGSLEVKVPQPERFELPNGLRVLYLQDKTLPIFRANLAFRAGSLEDPKGKEGLAAMTAKLLRSGGTDRSFWSQLDTLLESKGASVEFQAEKEFSSAKINCLDRDAELVLDQVAGMLQAPSFFAPRVEFIRGQMLADLKQIEDQPIQLALRSFQTMLFEGGSFGRFSSDTSLKNLGADDFKSFAQTWFVPGQAVLAVSSPLSTEAAQKLLTKTLDGWARRASPAPTRAEHNTWAKPGVYLRPKAGLTQATVLIGLPWVREDDADSVALSAALHTLGESGLASRIFNSVRTREGLAYAAGSFHLNAISTDGANIAYALTKAENAGRCIQLLRAEVERLIKDGLTQQELDSAKSSFAQSEIFSQVTTTEILDRAAKLEIFDRPQDTYAKRMEKLLALTLAEVHAAIKRHLKSEDLRVFLLADPKSAHMDQLGPITEVK